MKFTYRQKTTSSPLFAVIFVDLLLWTWIVTMQLHAPSWKGAHPWASLIVVAMFELFLLEAVWLDNRALCTIDDSQLYWKTPLRKGKAL